MAESIPITTPTFNFSVEAYHKMAETGIIKPTDRVELIEGKIITMSPMKSTHAACVRRLGDIMRHVFGYKAIVSEEKAITLSTYSEPQPDITIAKFKDDYYEEGHPTPEDIFVLIEVSLSTQKYDRETKVPLYASYNIPEVWIVDLKEKSIEVYEKPKGEGYTSKKVFGINDVLKSSFVEQLAVSRVIKNK